MLILGKELIEAEYEKNWKISYLKRKRQENDRLFLMQPKSKYGKQEILEPTKELSSPTKDNMDSFGYLWDNNYIFNDGNQKVWIHPFIFLILF